MSSRSIEWEKRTSVQMERQGHDRNDKDSSVTIFMGPGCHIDISQDTLWATQNISCNQSGPRRQKKELRISDSFYLDLCNQGQNLREMAQRSRGIISQTPLHKTAPMN